MDHSKERLLELVIAGGHPSKLLELTEQSLDLPVMMPPKVEVGWPNRPATGPR